ncbi:LacI family DNA-binding transcriptional regulator [uncultured Amnibacterium sp.]|uniref:LacI family DNA-binding transcriptional regulator n=1 Tax=uncultured Amnibacterium sp. TaxID=1631851 RepID=UPI0035CB384C
MVDVAKRAGVSQTTVSFVLNDRRDVVVAEETRQRVLAAAAELDFRPNRTAQALRSQRPMTVGIVTNGIVSPYAGRIVQGLQNVVQPADYVCMAVDTTGDPEEGDAAVANMLDQGVACIVYSSFIPRAVHVSALLRATPTVFVNCWPEQDRDSTVILADEYGGGRAAAKAAFDRGHRDVVFLGGETGEYAWGKRRQGFWDAARSAGLDPDDLVQVSGNYSIGAGYDLTTQIFRGHHPTALVCGNDRMAIGALLALHALGMECPRDVSIVGFDDQPDVADQLRPSLTTVALPHLLMGARAGSIILDEPDVQPKQILVPCNLVLRESLAAPREDDAARR